MATLNHIHLTPKHRFRSVVGLVIITVLGIVAWSISGDRHDDRLDAYKSVAEVQFADPVLDECVKATGRDMGWTSVGNFVVLNCSNPTGERIRNLDGIQHMIELTEVNLSFNEIADIGRLAELSRLAVLDLSHNRIRQLPALRFAPELRELELNHNELDSLDWIAAQHFPLLELLALANNDISEIDAIGGLGDCGK